MGDIKVAWEECMEYNYHLEKALAEKDKEIERLKEEKQALRDDNDITHFTQWHIKCEECDKLRKALEVCEKVVAQIWDCKYESDKIHIFIRNLFGVQPDDLLKKHRGDLYNISKEDRHIATEALKGE